MAPHSCAATTWGLPSAPKRALLIHGLASSSHTWFAVAQELAKNDYYVVAPDLLGHGFAPESPSGNYNINDFVANILPLVNDQIPIDLLVGHSLGGPVSLALFPHLQSKPKRFILVDPALEIATDRLPAIEHPYLAEVRNPPTAKEYQERNPMWSERAAAAKSFAASLAREDAVGWITTKINPWSFTKLLPPATHGGPELIIIGADPKINAIFTPAESEFLATSRPDIKTIVATGAGHGIQREQPDFVVKAALKPFDEL